MNRAPAEPRAHVVPPLPLRASAPPRRGGRRLRADHRVVHGRLHHPHRGEGHDLGPPHLQPRRFPRSSSRGTSSSSRFGLYRGVWRYAGARDAASIFAAVVLPSGPRSCSSSATVDWHGFPRGVFVIDALLCVLLIGASRFWERGVAHALGSLVGRGTQDRTLIVGAGRSGRSLLRELRETPGERVVGFVDDDPAFAAAASRAFPSSATSTRSAGRSGASRPTPCSSRFPKRRASGSTRVVEACSAQTCSAGSSAGTSTSTRAPSSEHRRVSAVATPRRVEERRGRASRRGPAARRRAAREHLSLALRSSTASRRGSARRPGSSRTSSR